MYTEEADKIYLKICSERDKDPYDMDNISRNFLFDCINEALNQAKNNEVLDLVSKRDPITKKCDWCDKRKKVKDMYRIGKFNETHKKEYWICGKCNIEFDVC